MVRPLGSGAFGTVWLARDSALDDLVAIKVMAADKARLPDMRERFVREARLLRKVRSDRVVTVHDIGETPDGTPYFVMAYADGGTLDQRLDGGPLPVATAVHLAAETARGVAELHRQGLVHRDIKPSNVLFSGAGAQPERVLIGDLGLAIDADCSQPSLIGGTPAYMAPEQARGAGADTASDVYALGVLTYRLLTGRLPAGRAAPRVKALVPGVSAAVDSTVMRALSEDPGRRHDTAADFADALGDRPTASALSTVFGHRSETRARRRTVPVLVAATVLGALVPVLVSDGLARQSGERGSDAVVLGSPGPAEVVPSSVPVSAGQTTSPTTSAAAGVTTSGPVPAAGSAPPASSPSTQAGPGQPSPPAAIQQVTAAGATTGWWTNGDRVASVRVPPRSLVVVTSATQGGNDSANFCTVRDSADRTWRRIADVVGVKSHLWVDAWFNDTGAEVVMSVTSDMTLENNFVIAQEIEVLSGVADPAATAPKTRATFRDAGSPAQTATAAQAGSRMMLHFIATSATTAPGAFVGGSAVSSGSVIHDDSAELAAGVIFARANTAAPGAVSIGAAQPTSAMATGVVIEYPAAT
ncbi:MAG TPA: protein kinase [Actinokineospora sp.]|nr:protein kinase [Actinokineospora sp.]